MRTSQFPEYTSSVARTAFTLVEMLVAIAVFSIIMLLLTQFIITASRTAISENAKMDSLSDAREALDRFGLDWSARVRRIDVAMSANTDGNNCPTNIAFITQSSSYTGTRQVSSVCYQMATSPYALQRGIVGYNWSGTPLMVTTSSSVPPAPITPATPATTDYDSLSGDVFRLSICFLGTNGYSTDTSLLTSSSALNGVVVTLAALDPGSRKTLTSAQFTSLAAALPVTSLANSPVSPLTTWQDDINSGNFATTANVPKQVASAVRVYQRTFYTKE